MTAREVAKHALKKMMHPFIRCLLIMGVFLLMQSPALAASPIGVVKSARNAQSYQDLHLGTFDDDYLLFRHALENANVRYDELSDADLAAGSGKLSAYKLIVLPLSVDLTPEGLGAITEFVRGGGKLVVTDANGMPQPNGIAIDGLAGVTVSKQSNLSDKQKVEWPRTPFAVSEEFAIGTVRSDVSVTEGAQQIAKWLDSTGREVAPAVVRKGGCVFLTWAPGLQGEITANSNLISLALEELVPGITQTAAVQISFADYQSISQELEYLTKRTEETIKTAKQAELAVPFKLIQQFYDSAVGHVNAFKDAYQARKFFEADNHISQARQDFSMAFAQAMPVRPVEARCIWLDRGTIVSMRNPQQLSALFDKLKASGINVVYFETNNAGFPIYPSKLVQQNPAMVGWDPLGIAVREAHKRGMELHA
ncbi:MAG TPA: beta-galactosidase trimerization domain-containing protein, partial [Candidatus Melainabacteria bacterium]|nr:beta-galactosidase trimerization domain-containing protein [Candidatus Melainabacteria bacterium]